MVKHIRSMVDMKHTPEDKKEETAMYASPPDYPYGLCISLGKDELEKLDLEEEEIELGDMLHLHCLAKVTSVSSNENEHGSYCRVELQITHIAAEDEDTENEEEDRKEVTSRLYKK